MKPMKSVAELQKFRSRNEWKDYIWKKLVEEIVQTVSVKDAEQLLNLLLTVHEKKQMIKRAVAISLLKQGKSYNAIGELLWLSPTTISAIRKSMHERGEYISRYTRNKNHEKKQKRLTTADIERLEFTTKLQALFTLPPPPIPHSRFRK